MELIFVIVLVVHGFIHLYDFASERFLVDVKEMVWKKIIYISPGMEKIIGVFWAVSWVLFWLSAIGIMFDQEWWKVSAMVGVVISQILIILHFKYTWWGTVFNLIIFLGVYWVL